MKNRLLAFIFSFVTISGFAQQDPIYSQYLMTPYLYNPAYSSAYDMMSLTAVSRLQWLNLGDQPTFATTNGFAAHSSFPNTQKMGMGIYAINDRLGPNVITEASIGYSYRIDLNDYTRLSMGLQAMYISNRLDYSSLNFRYSDDPSFTQYSQTLRSSSVNFGTGLYLLNDEKYYFSLSVPKILNTEYRDGDNQLYRYSRHYYISGGMIFGAGGNLPIRPSFMIRTVSGAPAAIDLSTSVLLSQVIWGGVSLRNLNTLAVIGQLDLTEYVRLGFSTDLPLSDAIFKNAGTYEFTVNINFAGFQNQTVVPKYF